MGLVLPAVSSFPMRLQPIYEEFEKIAAWLQAIFRDPDKFTAATPFLFLLAVLVVLAFGPGKISLDYLWRRRITGSGAGADQSADAGNAPDQRTR
jgi:hypothetical protein